MFGQRSSFKIDSFYKFQKFSDENENNVIGLKMKFLKSRGTILKICRDQIVKFWKFIETNTNFENLLGLIQILKHISSKF